MDSLAIITKFNPSGLFAGQYLAVGRLDGCVTILDFETKRTIKFLMGHVKPITSLDWSRKSRYLLSASRDWNVIIWDLKNGERRQTIRFDAPVTTAQFHPLTSKLIVATLQSQEEAIFVELGTPGGRYSLTPEPPHSTNINHDPANPITSGSPSVVQSDERQNSRRKRFTDFSLPNKEIRMLSNQLPCME